MSIDAVRLKGFIDRITRLHEEIDGLKSDIADIYQEAKGARIVPKILRKVIARKRAKDPAQLLADEELLDAYMAALDGPTARAMEMATQGATAREIEQAAGIPRSTASRIVPLKRKRGTKPPHNTETGEITEAATPGVAPDARSEPSPPAEQSVKAAPSPERVSLATRSGEGEQSGTLTFDQITGPLPAHLRRMPA